MVAPKEVMLEVILFISLTSKRANVRSPLLALPRGLMRAQFGALQEVLMRPYNHFTNHFNNDSTIRVNNMKIKHEAYIIASI